MKKLIPILLLLALLAACSAAGQSAEPTAEPATTAPTSLPEATEAPAATELPAGQPTAAAAPTAEPVAAEAPTLVPSDGRAIFASWDVEQKATTLRVVDPATGEPVPGFDAFPLNAYRDSAYYLPHAFSADGTQLAVLGTKGQTCFSYDDGSSCGPTAESLMLVDVPAWKATVVSLPVTGRAGTPAFSQDGSRVALSVRNQDGSALMVFDGVTGDVLGQTTIPFEPALVGFANGGADVAVYGQTEGEKAGVSKPGTPQLLLLDAATLATSWETTFDSVLSGYWCTDKCDEGHGLRVSAIWTPAALLSPDGSNFYIVHADEDALTAVDLAARAVREMPIAAAQSWIDRLLAATAGVAHAKGAMNGATRTAVISPDGKTLYVSGETWTSPVDAEGNFTMYNEALPLQAVDAATGTILNESDAGSATLRMTPDGQTLLLMDWGNNWPVNKALDAQTLDLVNQVVGPEVLPAYGQDGEQLLLGQHYYATWMEFSVIDPQTYRQSEAWKWKEAGSWVALP